MKTRTRIALATLTMMLTGALATSATSAAPVRDGAVRGISMVRSPQTAAGLDEVPWSSIGRGWLLAKWVPHPRARHPYAFLELVSPKGARYVLYRVPLFDGLADWSGDGQRVLLKRMNQDGTTSLRTLQLRTGAVLASFKLPADATASFTRPAGLAILGSFDVAIHLSQLTRYSFIGSVQRTFPGVLAGMGRWNGWWAMSPEGTQLAIGYDRGIAVLGNDGSLVAELHAPGLRDCAPTRWWTRTVILARCVSGGEFAYFHLFLFSAGWAAPRALTRNPRGLDFGDLDAWRVGSDVFVQASSGCGPGWVAQLHGTVPVRVNLPPIGPPGDGDTILGATSTALAVESMSCIGGASVGWFNPTTRSALQVLGPPLTSGSVDGVVLYPSSAG